FHFDTETQEEEDEQYMECFSFIEPATCNIVMFLFPAKKQELSKMSIFTWKLVAAIIIFPAFAPPIINMLHGLCNNTYYMSGWGLRGWATLSASQSMTQQPSKTSRSESDFPGIPFLVVIVGFTLINCAGGECLFFCATLHFPFHLANKNGDHFPLRCILYINGALEDGVACTITECFHFNKASVLLVPIAACDPLVFQLFYKTLDFSLPFCTALAYFLIYSASFIHKFCCAYIVYIIILKGITPSVFIYLFIIIRVYISLIQVLKKIGVHVSITIHYKNTFMVYLICKILIIFLGYTIKEPSAT
ncbi:hypothetical protein ACJX0J_008137, partial [Zea mays]